MKTVRLLEHLKKDPNLLNAMKDELKDMLDNSLERRGIPKVGDFPLKIRSSEG